MRDKHMQNKYPLWKNLVLIATVVIGLFYAIPNLYSDDPAVQISSQTPTDLEQLKQQVKSLLDEAKISYAKIISTDDNLEILFASNDAQLQGRDVIKNGIDSSYTVALNLAPATP